MIIGSGKFKALFFLFPCPGPSNALFYRFQEGLCALPGTALRKSFLPNSSASTMAANASHEEEDEDSSCVTR